MSYRTRTYPWLDRSGSVVIPFASDKKYHWWRGGQSAVETQKNLLKRREENESRDKDTKPD